MTENATTICATCGSDNEVAATICRACGGPLAAGAGYTLPVGTKLHGGDYSVGRVLGRGGFGITYAGADVRTRRPVAIKELFPEGSSRHGSTVYAPHTLGADEFSAAKQAFLDEGTLLARFNHPGIVKVYDVFEENGSAYLVMEFLRGDTLGARLLQEGRLEPGEVTGLARALLLALEQVHNQGLLHRDIKPDNILLSEDHPGSPERAVLIDFGSARQFQHGKTTRLTRLLTPDYAAPEQYQSAGRFGPYTDLYGLGATLYHALTGDKPPAATDRMITPQPLDFPASAPADLVEVLRSALALRVEQRPGTARALLDQLPDIDDQPLPPLPPPPPPDPSAPLQPRDRRNLGIGAVIGIVLFVLQTTLGLLGTLLWGGIVGALGGAALAVFFGRRGGSSRPIQQTLFASSGLGAAIGALFLGLSSGFAGFLLFTTAGAWLGYDLARMPASRWSSKVALWLEGRRDTLRQQGWLPWSAAWQTLQQQPRTLGRLWSTPTYRGATVGVVAALLFAVLLTSPVGALFALALLGVGAIVGRRYAKRYTPHQSPQSAIVLGLIAAIPGVLVISGLLGSPLGWGVLMALGGYGGKQIAAAQQRGQSWRETVLGWVDSGIGAVRGLRAALPSR